MLSNFFSLLVSFAKFSDSPIEYALIFVLFGQKGENVVNNIRLTILFGTLDQLRLISMVTSLISLHN